MDGEVKEVENWFKRYVEEEEYPIITSGKDIILRDAQKLVSEMRDKQYRNLKEYGLSSVEEAIHEVFERRHSSIDRSVHDAKRICLTFFLQQGRQNAKIPQVVSKSRRGKHEQLLEMLRKGREYHEAQLS